MYQLANLFLRASSFMGAGGYSWKDYESPSHKYHWVYTVVNAIYTILGPILAIVAGAGMIWAIVLGINMARADSQDKRDEAKKRLVSLIVGIAILVVLIVFFYTLFPTIMESFINPEEAI